MIVHLSRLTGPRLPVLLESFSATRNVMKIAWGLVEFQMPDAWQF